MINQKFSEEYEKMYENKPWTEAKIQADDDAFQTIVLNAVETRLQEEQWTCLEVDFEQQQRPHGPNA